jgi:prolyl oligopeptidase
MNKIGVLLAFNCLVIFGHSQLKYPVSKKTDIIDTYFNTKVADPYRWLENDNSEETAKWVAEQNKVTASFFANIPFRNNFFKRVEEIYNYPKYSAPFQKKDWIYWYYNDGLQNQSSIYRKNKLTGEEEIVINPNTLSPDGTIAIKQFKLNKQGTLAAISFSESGSDWQKIKILDLATRQFLSEEIKWVKFSGIAWVDDGFYYSRFPEVYQGSLLSAENKYNKVYHHKIGTYQYKDRLVYQDATNPNKSFYTYTSEDERFLFLSISERGNSKRGNALYVKKANDIFADFVPIKDTITDYSYWGVDALDNQILLGTNEMAPNNKIISIPISSFNLNEATTIIPEKKQVLDEIVSSGGRLFVQYLEDVATKCYIHKYNGDLIGEIVYPDLGTASNVNKTNTDSIIYYSFNSFGIPQAIYQYNLNNGKSSIFKKSEFKGETDIITERIFYNSKDGTRIPMFIVHKKEVKLDGKNPTLLYGYGGFNIAMQPNFNPTLIPFLEAGGIYAQACIRGGGEYGEDWHQAGTKLKKQNVFNDFIAAAEFLIQKKYTSPNFLAIRGGSNGGLLVGAVTNQRPDLFRVAIPQVGVMDMLRFHKFTIGNGWVSDYGSSETDFVNFNNLYSYSPLHNIKTGINYPSILVTTADHDDRVVPAHSFKYAATLQEKYKGKRPMLIRIDTKSGHGASNTTKMLELTSDIYSFIFHEMGLTPIIKSSPAVIKKKLNKLVFE